MMDNHRMLLEAGQATFLSGGDVITRCCITMTTRPTGNGRLSFASASKGHPSNHQRVARAGAVQDQSHPVSRRQDDDLDKPLDLVSLSELCSSERFTGGLL